MDRNNRLTGKENIFSGETKTLIFRTKKSKIESENIEIFYENEDVLRNFNFIMKFLAKEKLINSLMVESGSGIFDALLNEQLIDELVLYQAPKLLGKERKTFSKFNQTGEKLSTIDFEVKTITNLGQDKKITLTPNYT